MQIYRVIMFHSLSRNIQSVHSQSIIGVISLLYLNLLKGSPAGNESKIWMFNCNIGHIRGTRAHSYQLGTYFGLSNDYRNVPYHLEIV